MRIHIYRRVLFYYSADELHNEVKGTQKCVQSDVMLSEILTKINGPLKELLTLAVYACTTEVVFVVGRT